MKHIAGGELGRLRQQPDVASWTAAAKAWTQLQVQPQWGAYIHWREAEAMLDRGRPRAEAAKPLRTAAELADRLDARPLLDEITQLAARARIPLPHDPASAHATAGSASRTG